MASLSKHPLPIALDEAGSSVAAAARDMDRAASCAEGASRWELRLRTLDRELMDVLRKLHEIEDEFIESMKEK